MMPLLAVPEEKWCEAVLYTEYSSALCDAIRLGPEVYAGDCGAMVLRLTCRCTL